MHGGDLHSRRRRWRRSSALRVSARGGGGGSISPICPSHLRRSAPGGIPRPARASKRRGSRPGAGSAAWPSACRTSQRSWSPEYLRFSSTEALRSLSRRRSAAGQLAAREHDDRDLARLRALEQAIEHAEAVELRHREIHHEHVGGAHGDHRERLEAVGGLAQLAAVARQRLHDEPAQRQVVVHDEHGGALGRELAGHGLAQLVARERLRHELGRAERGGGAAPLLARADDHGHVRGQRVGLELHEHLPAVERAGQVDVEADHGRRPRERALEPGLAGRGHLDLEAVEREALARAAWRAPGRPRSRARARGCRRRWRARRSAARTRTCCPRPRVLSKPMRPPWAVTISWQSASPRPVPPISRVSEESTRKKRVKTCACWSAGMPRPESLTCTRAKPSRGDRRDRHGAAGGRVLDRVGEQVGDHLPDAVAVADHRERLVRRVELEPVIRGLRREELDLVLEQLGRARTTRARA